MKIALIIPCNIWFAPFVNIYTRVLDEHKIQYDIISWNKDGNENNKGLQYEKNIKDENLFVKLFHYVKFASFVKKIVKKNKYDKLFVFTAQAAIFLHRFLEDNYKGKYIFDYRDLSIEQKKIFSKPMKNALNNSYANVVSSPGFIKHLPEGYKYYLSHNFDIELVQKALQDSEIISFKKEPYNILTIGGIRDYELNIEIVDAFANKENIIISFVGRGPASEPIKQYIFDNKVKNAVSVGYYNKNDEGKFVKEASFVNTLTYDSAMTNRFYNALIFKKPMIASANSTQGEYVKKYRLGLLVENCNGLHDKCIQFLATEDNIDFNRRCNDLLKEFINDYEEWSKMLHNFIYDKQC